MNAMNATMDLARAAGMACGAALYPEDPDMAKAVDLQHVLEQTARSNGYRSYAEMQRRIVEQGEDLEHEAKYQALKRLAPAHHDANEHLKKRSLPAVDITGLVAIQDMVKSIARLIRILLVGYTDAEREELADRMKAERALEVDSIVGQRRAIDSHEIALERLADLAAPHNPDSTPTVSP